MKKIITLAIVACALIVASCSKGSGDKQKGDPLYGMWADPHYNYALILSEDSISYMLNEMNGIEFRTAFQKKDKNTLTFEIPENGKGTLTLNPEPEDITMVLELADGPQTINIPAHDHFGLATTAPHIASTFLFEEDMETVADTLRSDRFLPLVADKEDKVALLLPNGKKGWIKGEKISLVRGKLTPYFLEQQYSRELEDLRGHKDRIESYSFTKMPNGKTGVLFSRIFMNGSPAQEQYYAGDLDGIKLNVSHSFSDYTAWEEGKMESATPLDKPFEITMVDCLGAQPFIQIGNKVFYQTPQDF